MIQPVGNLLMFNTNSTDANSEMLKAEIVFFFKVPNVSKLQVLRNFQNTVMIKNKLRSTMPP